MTETSATRQQRDVSKEQVLTLLQKIVQSKTFSHSTSLRQALEFIVRNSLASPSEPIKEFSIATEVFGRRNDFDPKADNIVRVQMHRLREKLDEYYLTNGQGEQLRIVIPRGQYSPEYVYNSMEAAPATTNLAHAPDVPGRKSRLTDARWIAIIALLVCNGVLAVGLLRGRGRAAKPTAALAPPLRSLWQPFLSPGSPPLIVFANPAFLVDERGNLDRYTSPEVLSMPMGTRVPFLQDPSALAAGRRETGPLYYFDSYTGTGELVAAARIAQFLTAHGNHFLIERSRIASYQEIKDHNVIFLGGVKEDSILRKLPLAQELTFEPPPPNEYPMGSYIQDMNPPAGHPATYHFQLDAATGAIRGEYALISLLPSISTGHYVLDLGGLSTLGTEAAADFVTSEHNMTLLEKMRVPPGAAAPHSGFFQALLEVRVRDGVPLDAKCSLVRELKQPGP